MLAPAGRFAGARFNGGRFGIADPWSRYKAGGRKPKVIADFRRQAYRSKNGNARSLGDFATFSRAGLATMVDSDGKLKWAPHNLTLRSDDLISWGLTGVTATADTITENFSNSLHRANNAGSLVGTLGAGFTFEFIVENVSGSRNVHVNAAAVMGARFNFNPVTGVINNQSGGTNSVIPLGGGRFLVRSIGVGTGVTGSIFIQLNQNVFAADETYAGDGASSIRIINARFYRSDLGGMVNNPDTGDSYVPTTTAAVYLPRVGHHVWNGSAWVNKGLLIESEARTNLCLWSNDLTNAVWTKTDATPTLNSVLAPDGSNTGTLVTEGTLNTAIVNQSFGIVANGIYSFSLPLRRGNTDWIRIIIFDLADSNNRVSIWVNLATGMVGSAVNGGLGSDVAGYSIPIGGGWYRVSLVGRVNNGAVTVAAAFGTATGDLATNRVSGGTYYTWHSQFEAGAIPSSLIPTTSAAVTRAAETMAIPAGNMAYSSTAMSFAWEGEVNYADRGVYADVHPIRWVGGANQYILYRIDTFGADVGRFTVASESVASGVKFAQTSGNFYTPGVGVPVSFAGRNTTSEIRGAAAGTLTTLATGLVDVPIVSGAALKLCDTDASFMGTISSFRQWDEDIGDAGITAASLPLAA